MRYLVHFTTVSWRDSRDHLQALVESLYCSEQQRGPVADLIVASADESKVLKLNRVLTKLDPARHDWFVQVDDDVRVPRRWIAQLEWAAQHLPACGQFGWTLFHQYPELEKLYWLDEPIRGEQQDVRLGVGGQVAGSFWAMPARVAVEVGETPYVERTLYSHAEDWWRTRRIEQLGYRWALITATSGDLPAMPEFSDPREYLWQKWRDVEAIDAVRHRWFEDQSA